jgi:hypothetical protein
MKEKGHVAAQRSAEDGHFLLGPAKAKQVIESQDGGRGVTAPPSQAPAEWNFLAKAHVHTKVPLHGIPYERDGSMNEVRGVGGQPRVIALKRNSRRVRAQAHMQLVFKAYGLQ